MIVPEPRKLKSGSYFIQLRLNGVSVPVTAPTAKECKRQAELIKAEHRSGKRVVQEHKSDPTLGQAIDHYIGSRRNVLSPSTIRGYETIRRNRFRSIIKRPISTVKDWQAVVNKEAALCSAKTLKSAWCLAASAIAFSGLDAPKVTLPQIIPASRPWLNAEQIRIFVDAVHGHCCEIPALLALHSLRRSEIMALTWEHIDLNAGTIRVEGSAVFDAENKLIYKPTNKSRNSRRKIPIMIPALMVALESVPESERTGALLRCNPNTIWAQINRVCETANLPKVGVHGLRHSFASLAHHVGLPEEEAMLIGGWEDAQTMHKIYTHIAEADRMKAENMMAAFYKNANENANKNL